MQSICLANAHEQVVFCSCLINVYEISQPVTRPSREGGYLIHMLYSFMDLNNDKTADISNDNLGRKEFADEITNSLYIMLTMILMV